MNSAIADDTKVKREQAEIKAIFGIATSDTSKGVERTSISDDGLVEEECSLSCCSEDEFFDARSTQSTLSKCSPTAANNVLINLKGNIKDPRSLIGGSKQDFELSCCESDDSIITVISNINASKSNLQVDYQITPSELAAKIAGCEVQSFEEILNQFPNNVTVTDEQKSIIELQKNEEPHCESNVHSKNSEHIILLDSVDYENQHQILNHTTISSVTSTCSVNEDDRIVSDYTSLSLSGLVSILPRSTVKCFIQDPVSEEISLAAEEILLAESMKNITQKSNEERHVTGSKVNVKQKTSYIMKLLPCRLQKFAATSESQTSERKSLWHRLTKTCKKSTKDTCTNLS